MHLGTLVPSVTQKRPCPRSWLLKLDSKPMAPLSCATEVFKGFHLLRYNPHLPYLFHILTRTRLQISKVSTNRDTELCQVERNRAKFGLLACLVDLLLADTSLLTSKIHWKLTVDVHVVHLDKQKVHRYLPLHWTNNTKKNLSIWQILNFAWSLSQEGQEHTLHDFFLN